MKAVNGLDDEEGIAILTRGCTQESDGSRSFCKTFKICGPRILSLLLESTSLPFAWRAVVFSKDPPHNLWISITYDGRKVTFSLKWKAAACQSK